MHTNKTRLLGFAPLILVLLAGVIQANSTTADKKAAGPSAAALKDITVSFKLDPRITRGMYMGDRWVSPPTYTNVQTGKKATIEARVQGLDAQGKLIDIDAKWTPSDPKMVTVTSSKKDHQAKITVRRAGKSSLKVATEGLTKTLSVKAVSKNNALQVDITQ